MKLRRREIRVRCVNRDITGRKQAEDALRQRESDLAEAQRVAHLGNWTFDIATGAVRWSEELYRIFDIKKTAFKGTYKAFLSRVHPDDRTRVLEVNAKTRLRGEPFEVEYRIRTRSGQLKHIREVGYARKDRGGAVSGLFGTAQDITERKQVEEALRESENRFRKVVDRAPEGIFLQVNGHIQYVNPAALATFGAVTAAELIGQPMVDRVHPDYHAVVAERLRLLIEEQGSAKPLEERFLRMDGTPFDVEVTAVPLTFEGREGAVVFFREVTSRKRAEHTLRESEELFRSLFEEAPIAYNEIDQRGVIRRVNHASCTLIGYSANELVGRFVWDLIVPDLREACRQAMVETLNSSRPGVPFETAILCKDGSPIQVEIHETLIRGNEGEIIGLRAALLDNRQRKIAERASWEARQYNFERKIKNDELAAAVDSARQANLVKSRFLANMSHELRTPLNGIIGLSEVLYDELLGELSPGQKEYVGDILASGRHLLNVANNLLDLERIELGKMEFYPGVVDVQALLKEVCDVLRTLADEKGLTVSVTVDSALGTITTDPVRLRQIVYHYLSNAINFSPSGGVVRMRAEVAGAKYFRVEVADNGPGIPPERLSSIFADFYELSRTQRRENEGAGLGLALTKRIVEAQGGTVGVQSVPGAGSTFYAILPTG
jgi:PAS domain S-box-containing protein